MSKRFIPSITLTFLLGGCVFIPLGVEQTLSVTVLANGQAEIQVTPNIKSGGYQTQTVINPYGSADVHHLKLAIVTVQDGIELPLVDTSNQPIIKDIANSSLNAPVSFPNLQADTTYRIRAIAYKAAGTATDDIISVQDASSYAEIHVAHDNQPATASLNIQLIDRLFSASGSSNITLATGSVVNSTTSESIN